MFGLPRLSLLSKILLSTTLALTLLFAVTAWIVQQEAVRMTSRSIEEEVRSSFQAYQSLWKVRAERLAAVGLVLSQMSDVRAAFSTRDRATIRDTAGELWKKISSDDALFVVTDPAGIVIACLGGLCTDAGDRLPAVDAARAHFPAQGSGILRIGEHLYQVAVTPVYVDASGGSALLNVLLAGQVIDDDTAKQLRDATGGSEFLFLASGAMVASSMSPAPHFPLEVSSGLRTVRAGETDYSVLDTALLDIDGRQAGQLRILRSFEGARRNIASLQQNLIVIWLLAVLAGFVLTYALASRILQPVRELDAAAAAIARGNFDTAVEPRSGDEIGRLARTFQSMSASLKQAREDLIRQEQLSTIGRLSTSIVHDLRNPLAAIYGGSELLVDGDLTVPQVQRLASNIYRASKRVQELLQELVDVTRGRVQEPEVCGVGDLVEAAMEISRPAARGQGVTMEFEMKGALEVPAERSRLERVLVNLIGNALDAMPQGGRIRIHADAVEGSAIIRVEDTGPGISTEIAGRLFQPFVTAGKKAGLGLGLALSRQTVRDHGGDLWVEAGQPSGACFVIRLPLAR